jgi:hypothetical protein
LPFAYSAGPESCKMQILNGPILKTYHGNIEFYAESHLKRMECLWENSIAKYEVKNV